MSDLEMGLGMLESGRFSDFIIECRGFQFHVHRCIISQGSPVLLAACNGSFMVGKEIQSKRFVY